MLTEGLICLNSMIKEETGVLFRMVYLLYEPVIDVLAIKNTLVSDSQFGVESQLFSCHQRQIRPVVGIGKALPIELLP